MPKIIIAGLALFFLCSTAISQETCEGYLPFEEGLSFEQTHYDARGMVTTVSRSTIGKIQSTGDRLTAVVQTRLYDEKTQAIGQNSYEISCENGIFWMHANNLLNPCMLEAYQSMDISWSGEGLPFPATLTVEEQLSDGHTVLEVASSGLAIATLNYSIEDRRVEAKEKVTTPAGTFACFKIRETVHYQAMFRTRTYTTVGWFAHKVGLVKQETYDHKGDLVSRMEMTELSL